MKLTKILRILFLGPVIAIVGGIPGGNEKGEGNSGKSEKDIDVEKGSKSNDNLEGNEKKVDEKRFTQGEIDTIVEKRLSRERKNYEKEYKKKLERSKMDEKDRAVAEKEDAEKRANEAIAKANTRLIRSEVNIYSANMNLIDSEAAYALMSKNDVEVNEDGKVIGVEEALKNLISNKPWLVKNSSSGSSEHNKTGDDQSNSGKPPKKFDMNEMIRKAAGR